MKGTVHITNTFEEILAKEKYLETRTEKHTNTRHWTQFERKKKERKGEQRTEKVTDPSGGNVERGRGKGIARVFNVNRAGKE